jgi:hypothetical protein
MDIPVANQHLLFLAEASRELLADIDRPMLPASAADCDRHCGTVIAYKRRQPTLKETRDIVNEIGNVSIRL